jgi:hypothetical protein
MLDAPDTAVLAVNLGTPETPTAPAVRRYLAEFLSDRRVVAIPPLLWKPLLFGLILPLRSGRSAAKYAQVWLPEGSPLMVYTRRLAQAMQELMPTLRVRHAMRYGAPALGAELDRLAAEGVRRVVVLPLYPQYSTTTTASIEDQVRDWQPRHPAVTVTLVRDYAVDPEWVAAVADSIQQWWQQHGRGERLVFSFHGIPQRLADAGEPLSATVRGQCAGDRAGAGPGRRCLDADLPVALRPREMAAALRRADAVGDGRKRRQTHRPWSARVSPRTAWKRWRKWRWGSPKLSPRAVRRCATSPASTMRLRTRWRCRG